MMPEVEDDFGFVSFDDLAQDSDEFGFVPFEPIKQQQNQKQDQSTAFIDEFENGERPFSEMGINDQPEKNEEPSLGQKIASHPITQVALGAAKFFTWPLDALKLAMQGEGLSDIDEIEEAFAKEGKPFDRKEYIKNVQELTNSIPTQQFIEDLVKEKTGIDLAPQGIAGRILRQGSEILATGPKGLLEAGVGQISKRGTGALAGAGLSEGLKQAGAPDILSDIAGYALGGSLAGKSMPEQLSPEAKKLTQIAEKHGLRQFEGMQREVAPKNPIVSSKKQAKITQKLSETSKEAIEKVIENKLPIKTLRDSGIDLKDAYAKAFDQAHDTAKNSLIQRIDLVDDIKWMEKKISDIKSSAPSLSSTDEILIKELNRHKRAFKKAKNMTPEQALDQYKNFNEEVSGIYRKAEFTGAENAVKGLYEEMKSELIKTIDLASPELAKELKFANKIYSETANLNMVESILEKSFKKGYDPKKLSTTLGGNKNRAFLERALGKDAVKDMIDIASYGEKANEKVLSKLKTPKTAIELVKELTPLKFGLLALKRGVDFKTFGIPLSWDIGKGAINRAQGALFVRNATRKSYIDYLKKAVNPESAAFKKSSQELSKKIEEEFGSEEELMSP